MGMRFSDQAGKNLVTDLPRRAEAACRQLSDRMTEEAQQRKANGQDNKNPQKADKVVAN
jgi:hypothetical protein